MAQGLGAFGELDQHHTDVFHHRQQHLAQALDLFRCLFLVLLAMARHLAELPDMLHARDAFDQHLHIGAEVLRNLFLPVFQILGHRMQDRCGDGFVVHVHAGQDRSRAQRVLDQRCAGEVGFAVVVGCGKFAGAPYRVGFSGSKSLGYGIKQGLDAFG